MTPTLMAEELVPGISKLYQLGTGVISGVTQINGVPAKCRVRLEADNMPTDIIETSATGDYTCTGLSSGTWRLIIESLDGSYRGKTEILNII